MEIEDGRKMDVEVRAQLQSIVDAILPADRLAVASLPHEHVILLHHGLGTLIRNRRRAGELGALFRYFRDQTDADAKSLDDLSYLVLVAVWTALRNSSEDEVFGRPKILN